MEKCFVKKRPFTSANGASEIGAAWDNDRCVDAVPATHWSGIPRHHEDSPFWGFTLHRFPIHSLQLA